MLDLLFGYYWNDDGVGCDGVYDARGEVALGRMDGEVLSRGWEGVGAGRG